MISTLNSFNGFNFLRLPNRLTGIGERLPVAVKKSYFFTEFILLVNDVQLF